ncbi:MAG: hypothetical protein KAY24_06980 [Candidatus Eisenbacteria sp.]|nr:hypothetical protein [Candidatus Eisenbacteria bacterium]
MGQRLERMRVRKRAFQAIDSQLEQPQNILVIHYSCESFYDRVEGRTPRITSIAIRNYATAQTQSFSIHKHAELRGIALDEISASYDSLERDMLVEFFRFVSAHSEYTWLHWNMRDINYGFQAIEHRLRVLGEEPVVLQGRYKFDLARALIDIYGVGYIGHPRLQSLVSKNHISDLDMLSGRDEAAAFENGEFVRLHQSTLRKVDVLANVLGRLACRTLRTNARWTEIHGLHPGTIVEVIMAHWIYQLVAVLVTLGALVALAVSIF